MNNLRRFLVWSFMIIGALPMYAKENFSFVWKAKGDKMALIFKEKGKKDEVVTDYIYDRDCWFSYGASEHCDNEISAKKTLKLNKNGVALLIGQKENEVAKRGTFVFVVKRNGMYGLIDDFGSEFLPCEYDDMQIIHYYIYLPSRWICWIFAVHNSKGWGLYSVNQDAKWEKPTRKFFAFECQYKNLYMGNSRYYPTNSIVSKNLSDKMKDEWGVKNSISPTDIIAENNDSLIVLNFVTANRSIPLAFDKSSICCRGNNFNNYVPAYNQLLNLTPVGHGNVKRLEGILHSYHCGNHSLFPLKINNKYCLYDSIQQKMLYTSVSDYSVNDPTDSVYTLKVGRPLYSYKCVEGDFIIHNGAKIPSKYSLESAFRAMPFDPYDIYKVKNESGRYGLYNGLLGKEILPCKYEIDGKIDDEMYGAGFFYVKDNENIKRKAFISHSRDSVVFVDDRYELLYAAKHEKLDDDIELLHYKGGVGMIDYSSGLLLPCVYDSIKPLSTNGPLKDVKLTYRDNRVGAVVFGVELCTPVFEDVSINTVGNKIQLSTSHWMGIYQHEEDYNHELLFEASITADGDDVVYSDNKEKLLKEITGSSHNLKYLEVLALGYELDVQELCAQASIHEAWACEDYDPSKSTKERSVNDAIFYVERAVKLNGSGANQELLRLNGIKTSMEQQKAAEIEEYKRQERRERLNNALAIIGAIGNTATTINNMRHNSGMRTGNSNVSHSAGTTVNSSSSNARNNSIASTSVTKSSKRVNFSMNVLVHTYNQWISRLIDMNANYEKKYSDKDRISYQRQAREVRMNAEKYSNCSVTKSSWEDWNGKKR